MRNIVILSMLSFTMAFASAQSTPEEYIKVFFGEVATGNYAKAMKAMPVNQKLESDTSFTATIVSKLEQGEETFGKYCGYELISTEEVSPSFITFIYFIKYEEAPQRIQFIFYKPKDTWQLNRIAIVGGANNQRQNPRQRIRF